MRAIGILFLVLVLAVVAGGSAWAATVTSATTTVNGVTTVTYSVSLVTGESLQDFHVFPANATAAQRKRIRGTPVNDVGPQGPDQWVSGTNADGHFWRRGSSQQAQAVTGPATVQFALTIPASQFNSGLVEWVCTNDNNDDADDGEFDHGPGEGESATRGPIAAVVTPRDEADIGTTTALNLDSTEANRSYTYFVVGTDPASAPDPELCYASFVTWAQQNPVPSGWSLSFTGLTGTTDSDGDSSSPAVTVPNNSALVGQTFWVVAVVDAEPQGTNPTYKLAGPAQRVEISN